MNPLGAIRSYVSSDPRLVSAVSRAGEMPGNTQISVGDLKSLGSSGGVGGTQAVGGTQGVQGASTFGDMFSQMVQDVNSKQVAANDAAKGLVSGDNVSLHQAVISSEEANVSFQLMVEVRNKLLESYQEMMRMQV